MNCHIIDEQDLFTKFFNLQEKNRTTHDARSKYLCQIYRKSKIMSQRS